MAHEPSKAFEKAFMGVCGGSPVAECGCGRTVFASQADDLSEAELSDLHEKLNASPDSYYATDGGSVSSCSVMGREYVWGCPCEYWKRVDSTIWDNREQILRFIIERNNELSATAASAGSLLKDAGALEE